MKDLDESEKTPYGLIYSSLMKRHPMMFNAALAISLIALTAATVFLISDILSYNSDNTPAGLSSAFSFLSPLKGEQIENPIKAPINDTPSKDEGRQLSPLNRSETEKRNTTDDDASMAQSNIKGLKNSSLNGTSLSKASISSPQASEAQKAKSPQFGDSSGKSSKKKKHTSSNNGKEAINGGTTSSVAALNNSSELNQSQGGIIESNSTSMNLSNSSLTLVPVYNASVADSNLTSAANYLADSNLSETNPADNDISGLNMNSAMGKEDEAVAMPMLPVSNAVTGIPFMKTGGSAASGNVSLVSAIQNETAGFDNSSESQYPQNDLTGELTEPASIEENETSMPFSNPGEDGIVDGDMIQAQEEKLTLKDRTALRERSTQEDRRKAPASKFSSRSRDREDDQPSKINKASKTTKVSKRTTQTAKRVKTRPTRVSRDRDR